MKNCVPMIQVWATLNDRTFKPLEFGAAEVYASKLGRQLDADGDSELSLKEVLPRFSSSRVRGKDAKLLSTESLAYHDMNADGHTTVDEFATAFAAWSAVEWQAKKDCGQNIELQAHASL
ncbi:unnamed protein product [Prorocentrum cordatum]|uniref:Calmodulin n=1 Tax=Prorocentrum cordatum TaxID=2364126 RepID=A0ABN9RA12_9DINO|nr:unnamed protein product [Polarella glacialis]